MPSSCQPGPFSCLYAIATSTPPSFVERAIRSLSTRDVGEADLVAVRKLAMVAMRVAVEVNFLMSFSVMG